MFIDKKLNFEGLTYFILLACNKMYDNKTVDHHESLDLNDADKVV